ncbi:MAG: hypothetical protein K2O45_10720, partial [Oscillospiraceae bacterium]|nr:hypothetical protein [Oscillospiraceae bacterium]
AANSLFYAPRVFLCCFAAFPFGAVNAAGALTTTGSGAIPAMPTLEQSQTFMNEEDVLSCRQ